MKLAERLIEKHLSKLILEITLETCDKYFDQCFKEACQSPSASDTTLHDCYHKLKKFALSSVTIRLNSLMDETTDEMKNVKYSPTQNPFAAIAYTLWEEFMRYFDVDGYVENTIWEEYVDKKEKLEKEGIIDENGDYIKK